MSKPSLPPPDTVGGESCLVVPLDRAPVTDAVAADLAAKLKALADPVRLRLVSTVASHAGQEACVCDVSAGIALSQPTISHHLKVLRESGVLDSERRGSWVYYRVNRQVMHELSEFFATNRMTEALT